MSEVLSGVNVEIGVAAEAVAVAVTEAERAGSRMTDLLRKSVDHACL